MEMAEGANGDGGAAMKCMKGFHWGNEGTSGP